MLSENRANWVLGWQYMMSKFNIFLCSAPFSSKIVS